MSLTFKNIMARLGFAIAIPLLFAAAANAFDVPSTETDWRRDGFYTWDLVNQLEQELITDKSRLGPHQLGFFSRKIKLVVDTHGHLRDIRIISSSFSPQEDRFFLEDVRKLKFSPFPAWYNGKRLVHFPLEIRQNQRMAKPTNGPEFPIIESGIYFIDNNWPPDWKNPSPQKPSSYEREHPQEAVHVVRGTPEQLREQAIGDCKMLGIHGRTTIRARVNPNGFMQGFEIIKSDRRSKDAVDLFNLTYKSRGSPRRLNKTFEGRVLQIDLP